MKLLNRLREIYSIAPDNESDGWTKAEEGAELDFEQFAYQQDLDISANDASSGMGTLDGLRQRIANAHGGFPPGLVE